MPARGSIRPATITCFAAVPKVGRLQARQIVVASKSCLIASLAATALMAPPLLWGGAAQAGPQLEALNKAVSACVAVGKPQPCPAGVAALQQLRQSPAYSSSDRYCKEQVIELDRVLALLPLQDVTDQTVQGSLDGLGQACARFGL